MKDAAHDLARRLGRRAEAVCRHYLSAGRRQGHYWQVGDVRNTPGRSMFVRLRDSAHGPAGKWTDAATGEHGDLLDVIRESRGLSHFTDVAAEAEMFLGIPRSVHEAQAPLCKTENSSRDPVISARRLFAAARPIPGTIVETYLRNRGITTLHETGSLRFHPRCFYRPDAHGPIQPLPAMVAAVTDLRGRIMGVQHTWLTPDGAGKAAITTPRTLEKHRTYGTGPAYRKLGGRVVYSVEDLQTWVARGAVTSTSDPRGSILPAKRQALPSVIEPHRFAR